MAFVSASIAGLPLEQLTLYHAVDPILSSVLIFHGPVITANSTVRSSRFQAHIIAPGGVLSYPRITISPAGPLYAAVNHLPRDKQGDEIYRGLAVCLLKYFGDLSEPVRYVLLGTARSGNLSARLPNAFDEFHAAELANKMVKVEDPTDAIRDLRDAYNDRIVPWIDVDLVLPPGSIATSNGSRNSDGDTELQRDSTQYGKYTSLVEHLGEPVFLPTSKLRRAPSLPINTSKSKLFSAAQKETLRLAMCEAVDTEERYVGKMYDLVHNIIQKFSHKAADKPPTSTSPDETALKQLFPPCLNEILEVNMGFLGEIREILEQTEKDALEDLARNTHIDSSSFRRDATGKRNDPIGIIKFAHALLEWFPKFSQPYGDYMHTHHGFSQTLSSFLNDSQSSFSKRVYETGEQKMRSVLMEPVQRLPRYSLLIDAMTSALPSVHPAVKTLLKARDIITEICSLDSHSTKDNSRDLKRLQSLVEDFPVASLPSGRLIAAVDFYDLPPPYQLCSPEESLESGILLLYGDYLILLSKAFESRMTARGLFAELDKPPIAPTDEEPTPFELKFLQALRITNIRCTQSVCGRILYLTPAGNSVQNERSRSVSAMHALELLSTYEGKAGRLIEELTKARIEGRFPEEYRGRNKWCLRSFKGGSSNLGVLISVFEDEPKDASGQNLSSTVKLIFDGTNAVRSKELSRPGVEVVASISMSGNDMYKMEIESVVGVSSVDTFAAAEFTSVLSNRLNNVLRPLHQPENPILTSAILNTNFNIIRAVSSYILEHAKSGRGFRPPSPSKLLSNFWGGSPKGSLPPPRSLLPAPILREIPQILPPALDRSNSLALRPASRNGSTLVGVNSGENTLDMFKSLEETFAAYVIAIRSRSGNIVGRILRGRRQADLATVNELYNALLEDAGKIQLAAESPVDVLFVAFETFMANAWNEHIGPIISLDAWEVIQSKFDSMFPGDFEGYFHQFLTEMSPQNRRALTALVKLLAELLDASGNDGDRGALTATFSEILTDKGNAMEHISLLDRLVEDFDRLFEESGTLDGPMEGTPLNDQMTPLTRTQSVNTGSTNHGSISSNTSSFRKRFGFGSSRDRGKSESEGKVSSIIRTLSKSKAHGEADSQPPSFSKASLFRSRSIDTDSRLASLLRPVSRERLLAHGIFSASAEDQSLRPNSAHSNAPTLASIGEDPATDKPVTVRKKRRSSLSDLKALPATNVAALLPPIDLRRPLTPTSSPNAKASPEGSPPQQQSRPASRSGPQTPKRAAPANPSPSRPLVSSSKENAPPTPRTMLGERAANRKPNSAIPLQISPKRRSEGLSYIPSPRNTFLKDRVALPGPSDMNNGRPQSSSSIQRTPKLRMQNPQKLRERLQNEKKAIANAESTIKTEISSFADEISNPRLSPVRRRPGTPKALASPPSTSGSTATLHNRARSLESKVNTLLSELSSRTTILEKDIEDSLLVSERRARKLDELYREASAENSALYERFNVELRKVTKEVRLGAGEEALKSQLKEALDEVARVKKENLRLKREIGGLKAQHLDSVNGDVLKGEE
ncbi:rho guanyl nucleotide exchange factor [Blastomyces dermatitidis ER-3]|uniref:Rho guanyl nucleotide exchange factor n=1 Tax=Ajellomyces dermatitidis (strain ER-3 / ATCC MYA-2586) TaxID=559297 RepID=A0ABP2EPE9_AJEDR|nr:rho guanyl nucleotide exchange factor [Blastomyces dermatitidis ER-3]EEQ84872.1 rho guanyl nucleotide exchange factor [Blastomyces dermatitidis ER-3]